FTLSMVIFYAFTMNSANAMNGSQKVEKTFEYVCEMVIPIPGVNPTFHPTEIRFNMSVPKWVKAGEEFYLNDLTINFDYPSSTNPFDYEVITKLQSPNFKIKSENEAH